MAFIVEGLAKLLALPIEERCLHNYETKSHSFTELVDGYKSRERTVTTYRCKKCGYTERSG